MTKAKSPWASGPEEILKHGLSLLNRDSDSNRRLAMISIDNAVELMVKTYLGLPKRINGLSISRSEYQDFSESFPKLLDALEKHAGNKIGGLDLGEIEWYHRLRNQLYHQGNGLTVERDKIEVYAELSNILFTNLFGYRLIKAEEESTALLGRFMEAWVNFEKMLGSTVATLNIKTNGQSFQPLFQLTKLLEEEDLLLKGEKDELDNLRRVRNEIVHASVNYKDILTPKLIARLELLTKEIEDRISSRAEKKQNGGHETNSVKSTKVKSGRFLQTARNLNIDGPSDWSVNVDKYLYGEMIPDEE